MRRHKLVAGAVLGLAALGLAACSSGSASPTTTSKTGPIVSATDNTPNTTKGIVPATTTSTVSTAAVGQQVLSIISAGNAAVQTAKNEPGTSGYPAAASAFNSTAQQLQALTYPADAQADAKALVAVLVKLSVDVTQAESDQTSTILQNIENDEGTEVSDSGALRHDLGLPPAATS